MALLKKTPRANAEKFIYFLYVMSIQNEILVGIQDQVIAFIFCHNSDPIFLYPFSVLKSS